MKHLLLFTHNYEICTCVYVYVCVCVCVCVCVLEAGTEHWKNELAKGYISGRVWGQQMHGKKLRQSALSLSLSPFAK